MPIRQPIVCVLGHVDTGKTLLLDKIRKTSVQAREAGGITQHIGASFFPVDTLKQLCGPLLFMVKGEIEIPGLLVVDTPGHEAFTNLRKRGGSVADIAILVIDALRGFETQTYECIEILKARKTPFLVATNKIDRIPGWNSYPDTPFLKTYQLQDHYVKQDLDNRIYDIILLMNDKQITKEATMLIMRMENNEVVVSEASEEIMKAAVYYENTSDGAMMDMVLRRRGIELPDGNWEPVIEEDDVRFVTCY